MTVNNDCSTASHMRYLRLQTITIFVMALFSLIFIFGSVAQATDNAESVSQKHVLFINSYSYDYDTVPIVASGVEKEIRDIAIINYVFMDAKYVSPELAEEQLKPQLKNLMSKNHYDLVILGDDAALDFALKYQQTYFAGIPIIFEDVNSESKGKKAAENPYITGLVELFPIRQNIELAKKLQPDAKRIVVVMDDTVSSWGTVEQVQAFKDDFPELSFETLDVSKYSTEDLQHQIGTYGADTILFFGMCSVDGSGHHYNMAQGIRLVSQAANIPLYKADEIGIGDGLLGGYVLTYDKVGERTGKMARGILLGMLSPKTMSSEVSEYTYKFDYAVMKRFGITKSQVPSSAVFIHNEPTGMERYKDLLIPIGVVFLLLIISGLLIDRHRNRMFNTRLAESKATQRAAELSNQAKTEFLAKLSHDIRTPLTAILGITTLAKDQVRDPLAMRKSLMKIDSAGHLLLLLINDILDMSKIESGKMELMPESYPLDEFLANMRDIIEPACEKKNINLTITGDAEGKIVLIDKVRINQVIYNILSNSVKFTDPEGSISLNVIGKPFNDGTMMAIDLVVSDTGCGMTKEFQQRMFEPFSQDMTNPTAAAMGSGLGLAIVRNIVNLMGGTIAVKSELGVGTTICIHLDLPLTQEKIVPSETTWLNDGSLQGKHILLVEDNPLNTEIATLLLEKEGMIVNHASNGREAVTMLEEAADGAYDAVLMDIRMPVMNGIEATKAIRNSYRAYLQQVPIIAMTADAFEDDVKRSLAAGMVAHMTKPVEPNILYSVLWKYTHQQSENLGD